MIVERWQIMVVGRVLPFLACAAFLLLIPAQIIGVTADESPLSYVLMILLFGGFGVSVWRRPTILEQIYDQIESLEPFFLVVFCVAGYLAIHTLSGTVLGRRLVFAFWFAYPALALLPALTRRAAGALASDRIALGLVAIMALVLIVPGFYFPPFFDGIAGWTNQRPESPEIRQVGYKLVRNDGEATWVIPSITSPTSLNWRQISAAHSAGRTGEAAYLSFIFDLYQRDYPLLNKGLDANKRYLGRFAYPGHNPYRMMPYDRFPPEEVRYIAYVDQTLHRVTGEVISSREARYFDPKAGIFVETPDLPGR